MSGTFVLAGCGDLASARDELTRWCDQYVFGANGPVERKRDVVAQKLHALLEKPST